VLARHVEQVQPSGEWSPDAARRRLKYVEVRVASALPSETLRKRLGDLVRDRQELRNDKAAAFVLEQNRLSIVRAQHELAQALMSERVDAVSA
jgi:hypothetical protein